ncbi:MAG TPA: hypothetical protein VFW87_26295 [Pirellulales bacterium]|nr:hypothetical protein [Pirellulales bacterium]
MHEPPNQRRPRESFDPPKAPPPPGWSAPVRALVSLLVVAHLLALLAGPLSMPPSVLGNVLGRWFRPYIEAAYLDHAYKFFGPDPGPSCRLRYEMEMPDGSRREGVFPDAQQHWPRLWYHRHFVLGEFLNALPHADDNLNDPRLFARRLPFPGAQRDFARSYARHLLYQYGGRRVTLYVIEHAIPRPELVREGVALDDPRLDSEYRLGPFSRPRAWGPLDAADGGRKDEP